MAPYDQPTLEETAVWVVLALKQLSYGFDRLDEVDDGDPSPRMMFYFNAIYNQIAVLYLLSKKSGNPMGGALYPALKRHGLERVLDEVQELLNRPFGLTTFGEIARLLRNKAIVHTTYSGEDLDDIYDKVEMEASENRVAWFVWLVEMREASARLMIGVARRTGRPLSDFGIAPESASAPESSGP